MIKRISTRWFIWFTMIAVYAVIFGGLLYFNLFKRVFDVNLQNQVIDTVRQNASTLIEGLVSKNYLTVPENEIISSWPRQDNRIVNVVYFNGNGTVRWHKNLDLLDMPIADKSIKNKVIFYNSSMYKQALSTFQIYSVFYTQC